MLIIISDGTDSDMFKQAYILYRNGGNNNTNAHPKRSIISGTRIFFL